MTDQQLRDLFADQDTGPEPPLPPGFLESTTGAAHGAQRRRRGRRAALGGVAVLATLVVTGVAVAPHLGTRPPAPTPAKSVSPADDGAAHAPLALRLKPGWLPSGYNETQQDTGKDLEMLRFAKLEHTAKGDKTAWSILIFLYPPPAKSASSMFGHGTRVDPVQGMPAEHVAYPDGYALGWSYPTGEYARVGVYQAPGTSSTLGASPASVARKIAEAVRTDGHTPLRFPFTVTVPASATLIGGDVIQTRMPGRGLVTEVDIAVASSPKAQNFTRVSVRSQPGKGKPHPSVHGTEYTVPNYHGCLLHLGVPSGEASRLLGQVHLFGDPTDLSTWRYDPVRH